MTDILTIITKRVHPSLHHLVTADATFDDLRLNAIDSWGIAADWEIENDRELDWDQVEKWASVRDIIATVRQHEKVPS